VFNFYLWLIIDRMNRSGSVHPDCMSIDKETDATLCQSNIADDAFPKILRQYLLIEDIKEPYV